MAKSAPATSMPVDQAPQIAPGVSLRMADFFAQESMDRGFYVGFNGEPAGGTGSRSGNLSPLTREPPRPLTGGGPFKNLRGSR